MSRVFSIICHIVAGFFFYTVATVSFANGLPWLGKLAVMICFMVPALIALVIGLALNRFRNWKRDIGIVLLSVAGFMTFMVLTFICLLQTDEFRKMMQPDSMAFFSDYITGSLAIITCAILGIILIRAKKSPVEQNSIPKSDATDAPPSKLQG